MSVGIRDELKAIDGTRGKFKDLFMETHRQIRRIVQQNRYVKEHSAKELIDFSRDIREQKKQRERALIALKDATRQEEINDLDRHIKAIDEAIST